MRSEYLNITIKEIVPMKYILEGMTLQDRYEGSCIVQAFCTRLFSLDQLGLTNDSYINLAARRYEKKTLRKHAYSNTLKNLPPRNEKIQIKNSDIFHISAQNIDCGYSLELPRRGGSTEYQQSMFLRRNKKKNYTHVNPSFAI